jgi:hypothetical protein
MYPNEQIYMSNDSINIEKHIKTFKMPFSEMWSRVVPPKLRFTQEQHGATFQKTAFFVVTAMKTSNRTHKNLSAEYMRNYRKRKAQEIKTRQASSSTDPTPTSIIYDYNQANAYFQKNFIGNPFDYATTCDRLSCVNDSKQAKENTQVY